MSPKPVGGRLSWLDVGIGALLVAAAMTLAVLAVALATSPTSGDQAMVKPATTATPAPGSSRGPPPAMPSGDCAGCHMTAQGIGVASIPPLGHPLEGWGNCTACHAEGRLVMTAPGHRGIHAQDCLTCHKSTTPAAPPRPHSSLVTTGCLECHGGVVHLPSTMVGRNDDACWLCHRASTVEAPKRPHPLYADRTCVSCHVAGQVGALPASHEGRTDATCTLCHEVAPAVEGTVPRDHRSGGVLVPA